MEIRKINSGLSVSPQIGADDIATIVGQGFASIICNRPDGEEADQPPFEEIEKAAMKAGLQVLYLPVVSSTLCEDDVSKFGDALVELPAPVLAYCRSGTRSATLWSLSQEVKTKAKP